MRRNYIAAMGAAAVGGQVIDDFYPESNYVGGSVGLDSVETLRESQSFISNGGVLHTAKFYLARFGSPTGNVTAELYASTGTNGIDAKPTGSALAVSDNVDITTLVADPSIALATFSFSGANRYSKTRGTVYCIAVAFSGGDNNNKLLVGQATTTTDDGNEAGNAGGGWAADTLRDVIFYVIGSD